MTSFPSLSLSLAARFDVVRSRRSLSTRASVQPIPCTGTLFIPRLFSCLSEYAYYATPQRFRRHASADRPIDRRMRELSQQVSSMFTCAIVSLHPKQQLSFVRSFVLFFFERSSGDLSSSIDRSIDYITTTAATTATHSIDLFIHDGARDHRSDLSLDNRASS